MVLIDTGSLWCERQRVRPWNWCPSQTLPLLWHWKKKESAPCSCVAFMLNNYLEWTGFQQHCVLSRGRLLALPHRMLLRHSKTCLRWTPGSKHCLLANNGINHLDRQLKIQQNLYQSTIITFSYQDLTFKSTFHEKCHSGVIPGHRIPLDGAARLILLIEISDCAVNLSSTQSGAFQ